MYSMDLKLAAMWKWSKKGTMGQSNIWAKEQCVDADPSTTSVRVLLEVIYTQHI